MPPPRQAHDPFTDAPLRATTSNATSLTAANPSLRNQTSQHSLRSIRSNTSNASSRARQPHELFAPAMTRRGTTPRFEDEVFADTDSEQDMGTHRQKPVRRTRHGSPEGKYSRAKSKQEDDRDFLNRQPDGGYLLGASGFGGDGMGMAQVIPPKTEEELNEEEADAHYGAMARHFFAAGPASASKQKKHEEELEQYRAPMMMRLREQVVQQLEEERWRYEASG